MNYIYDIYLNFNEELYDFFDWDKKDKLIHIKAIPIFKVTEDKIKKIINNHIQISIKDFSFMLNKAITYTKTNKYKSYVLFCTNNIIIGIEFDKNGKSIKKSSLHITEELEIIETIRTIKTKDIKFKTINKSKNIIKTRKQINEELFIKKELTNIESKKLKYIFLECFGNTLDKTNNIDKLLKLSTNSKKYKKLYNILKLTSTSN